MTRNGGRTLGANRPRAAAAAARTGARGEGRAASDPSGAVADSLATARDAAERRAADVSDRFVRRAEGAGLIDVAYARADSPLGPLALAATERGLVRVAYLTPGVSEADVAAELAARVSPRVVELHGRLEPARRELEQYFAGERRRFDLRIDWRLVRGFGRAVLDATAAIPYGGTASYTQVAERAGNARASRAAGNALNRNPVPIVVPCHRVLQSGGGLGGYAGGLDVKRYLLGLEGALQRPSL